MNKAALIVDLQGQSCCAALVGTGSVTPIGTENNINHYAQAILNVDTNGRVAQVRNIYFMTVNEKTPNDGTESAYYDAQANLTDTVSATVQSQATAAASIATASAATSVKSAS